MTDTEVLGLSNEESIKKLTADHPEEIIGVIFTDTFAYHLKFSPGHRIPVRKEHMDHTGKAPDVYFCSLSVVSQAMYEHRC